jgi:hypothetical protein
MEINRHRRRRRVVVLYAGVAVGAEALDVPHPTNTRAMPSSPK